MKIFGKIGSYFDFLGRLWSSANPPKNRPHFYSKNAWSYRTRGKQTPAMALYLKLGA